MKNDIYADLKKIHDESKKLQDYRNWAIAAGIVFIIALFLAPDSTWKLGTAAVAGLFTYLYIAQSRRSTSVSVDEDKRKYFGFNRDLAPANQHGFASRSLTDSSRPQQQMPYGSRYRNIVQIPAVPVRQKITDQASVAALASLAFKDVMHPDNCRHSDEPTEAELENTASSPARPPNQDPPGFVSPISTPRFRSGSNSGSFSAADRAYQQRLQQQEQQQHTKTTPNKGYTPAKTFREGMAAMNASLAATMSATPKPTDPIYRPSPQDPSLSPYYSARRSQKLSPVPSVNFTTKSYYATTGDISSETAAAQWLGLVEVPDEWSESFRFVLGRHLHDQLALFDDVVEEIFTQLTLKSATGQAGGISHGDLLKAQLLLELVEERQQLDNGTYVEATEVLDLCRRIGISPSLIHRYELCLTLFHMPRILLQEAPTAASSSFLGQLSSPPPPASSGRSNREAVVFLKRLRELAASCPDGRLRISWDRSGLASAGSRSASKYADQFLFRQPIDSYHKGSGKKGDLTDQDIVMLLFLHRCDFHNTIWSKSIDSQHRFSSKHFVNSGTDIKSHVKSFFAPATSQTQLQQQLAQMPKAMLFRTVLPSGSPSSHFNVYCMSPFVEMIRVDEGRNDCFDSIVIFLLAIYKALANEHFQNASKSADTESDAASTVMNSYGMFALGTSGGINVSVVKDLLQDILNTKEEVGEYLQATYGMKIVASA